MNDITALSPVTPEMLASLKLSTSNLVEGEMMSFEPAVFRALVEALESGDTENERMARDLISRNGEIEGLRKRVEELEEVATDYGMKFQRAQDDLKKMALMHRDESRTVTVKLPKVSDDSFWLSAYGRLVFREETYRNAVVNAICDAGIQVIEGE